METDNWHIWCRLCAKNDSTNNISLSENKKRRSNTLSKRSKNTDIANINLAMAIEKFFQLKIKSDELPKLLCTGCHSLLINLENFSERVAKVQKMYKMLQKSSSARSPLDMNDIRAKFGLIDNDDEHKFVLFPEVQIELKPQIDDMKLCEEKSPSANPLELLPHIKEENLVDDIQDGVQDESQNAAVGEELSDDDFDSIHNDVTEDKEFVLEESSNNSECNDSDDDEDEDEDWDIRIKSNKKRKKADKINTKQETFDEEIDPNAPYTCSVCHRIFNRYRDYRIHMKRVHKTTLPPPKLPCPQCDRVFETIYKLKQHSKLHLPLEERRSVPCEYCDKKFLTNTDAKKHVRHEHMKERYYICEECGMELRSLVSLKTHMFQHSGLNPFKCEICGRGYKEKSKLKNHMEVHENKKFQCPECGRLLNTRLMLRRHLVVHSDVRKFKCDFCGREFKRSKALKVHLIMHTGLKPYVCNFCDRAFSTGSSCRLHKRTIHPEELAAFEAAGGAPLKPNLPNLKTLRAITKGSNNLRPVGSQQLHQQAQQQEEHQQQEEKLQMQQDEEESLQQISLAQQQNISNTQSAFHQF